MNYVIPVPQQPSVPVFGSVERFPVRRIYCVGRNYAAHVREMGNDEREPPFFFTKPASAIVESGSTIPYPPGTENLHFEAELVVAIGLEAQNVTVENGLDHVWGYATGNDLTRRDIQAAAKKMARPWDMAKGFDLSAPCGAIHPVAEVGRPNKGSIRLTLDGKLCQDADLAEMIWSVPEVIAYLSGLVTLMPGDLIYTGTPAGVGPALPGQTMTVEIEGLSALTTTIAA
ncbi:MAG: fumarylacetoacetate hydrolase family protein [Paracoccaceae bacterium]